MLLAMLAAVGSGTGDEVPIGAVVRDTHGRYLAMVGNRPIGDQDPTSHAEIRAIRCAATRIGNYRLTGCTLSVTLEPCAMCRWAIAHARLASVDFAAPSQSKEPHIPLIRPLLHGETCQAASSLLQSFFARRRNPQGSNDPEEL